MVYILYNLLYGILSGILSMYFRHQELREEVILMPRQIFTQIPLFIVVALIAHTYFSGVYIDVGIVKLWWFVILCIYSSLSFYAFQVFYEFISGNTLFATEQEMQAYIEKIEDERSRF